MVVEGGNLLGGKISDFECPRACWLLCHGAVVREEFGVGRLRTSRRRRHGVGFIVLECSSSGHRRLRYRMCCSLFVFISDGELVDHWKD